MGDGIVWYHPCGYLFKKIITSFYTYLCCLLNTFLLLSGLFVILWKYGVYVGLSESHQGSLRAIVGLNCVNQLYQLFCEYQRFKSKLYISVYIFLCVFTCFFLKLFKKNIQSCQFSPPILLRSFLLPLLILTMIIYFVA